MALSSLALRPLDRDLDRSQQLIAITSPWWCNLRAHARVQDREKKQQQYCTCTVQQFNSLSCKLYLTQLSHRWWECPSTLADWLPYPCIPKHCSHHHRGSATTKGINFSIRSAVQNSKTHNSLPSFKLNQHLTEFQEVQSCRNILLTIHLK